MIFVTIGNTDPFNRLIEAIDRWAERHREIPIFAQIGDGTYVPSHCQYARFLVPCEYRTRFEQASVVVAHAGMGAIITALELQKPIILLPRQANLGEQRNDHQLATAKYWRDSRIVTVVNSYEELSAALDRCLASNSEGVPGDRVNNPSRRFPVAPSLIRFVRDFIDVEPSTQQSQGNDRPISSPDNTAIFVTVGNTDPFDRLVEAVDRWAGEHPAGNQILAQIGHGKYVPRNCRFVRFLSPHDYQQEFARASLIVGHAGMGTIITALEQQKLIALLPRLVERGEVRNQHQLATTRHFSRLPNVLVAESDSDLVSVLSSATDILSTAPLRSTRGGALPVVDPSLLKFVTDFVQ